MKPLRPSSLTLMLLAALLTTRALAGEPAAIQITQAQAQGTEVTAYVAVTDESGAPVAAASMGQARATLGSQVAEVSSAKSFATTGEGVLTIFLVDVSRSLDLSQFNRIRQALRDWITALGDEDRVAILTFGNQVRTLVAPTHDRIALTNAIDGLTPSDNHTALHQALAQGLTLGRHRGVDLPSRRVLVILSDGHDDAPGGMTVEEVEMQLAEGSVPIYAIGFSHARESTARKAGLAALGRFARRSGGLFIDASAGNPATAYAGMRDRIRAVERLQVRCATCTADGNRYRLLISMTQDGRTLSDGVDVRLYPAPAPTQTGPQATAPAEATPAAATNQTAPATPEQTEPQAPPAAPAQPAPAAPDAPPAQPAPAAPDAAPAQTAPSIPVTPPADPAPAAPAISSTAASSTAASSTENASPPEGIVQRLAAWWPWLLGAGLLGLLSLILGLNRHKSRSADQPVLPETPEPAPVPAPLPAAPPPAVPQHSPVPPGPALVLAYMSGARRGQTARLVLAPDAIIGRTSACALALAKDDEVSGRHARLFVQDRRLLLEDLGSTNGTWLNGVRLLAPTPVGVGDVLRCGQTELRLTGIETEGGAT